MIVFSRRNHPQATARAIAATGAVALMCAVFALFLLVSPAQAQDPNAEVQRQQPTAGVEEQPAPADSRAPEETPSQDRPPEKQSAPEAPAPGSTRPAAPPTVQSVEPAPAEQRVEPQNPQQRYDWWVLAPAIVAIILAIATRQVVPALVIGVAVGAFMMITDLPDEVTFKDSAYWIRGIRVTFEYYVLNAVLDENAGYAHLKIMMFTLVIGFMVGVIGRNGGTAGLVKLVAGETDSQRRGSITAWLAGLVVFFDDYANTMIIGPTMRPIFDRLKLSRAKLAYIVDSTAAPVASLAIIGTWVGFEIGFIDQGLNDLGDQKPAFLTGLNGMLAFIKSIPYRFYPILALWMVFLVALTGRDFGPMKRSEGKALGKPDDTPIQPRVEEDASKPKPRWGLGLLPVLVLLGATFLILWITGRNDPRTLNVIALGMPVTGVEWTALPWYEKAGVIVGHADAYVSIFYGAIVSAVFALLLTLAAGACKLKDAIEAGLNSAARMFPAIVILILAWSLSQVSQDLMLGQVVTSKLQAMNFPITWLPLAIFVSAAVISFATGTSWGTMGILCPVAVTVGARLAGELPTDQALPLFYATVGSVLAGAIFGDHCSPISDTTVLSSLASDCPHEEHVWTQMPYAVVVAIVGMGLGDVLCSRFGQPPRIAIPVAMFVLLLFLVIFGRRPRAIEPPDHLKAVPPGRAWHRPPAAQPPLQQPAMPPQQTPPQQPLEG
jgi:Na+/H+ antiporter NhaC